MKPQTIWIIVGAVALLAFFLWKKSSSGASVTQIGGADSGPSSAERSGMLAALTGLAGVKYQSDATLATTRAQLDMQLAAINAGVESSRINANAQVAIANRQNKTTNTQSWLKTGGEIILASLPFIL